MTPQPRSKTTALSKPRSGVSAERRHARMPDQKVRRSAETPLRPRDPASDPSASPFSHLDARGAARMVNVGAKPVQWRRAVAAARLVCQAATIRALRAHALPKGDVLAVANIAGIQAAKRTGELIPLCHPLPLDGVEVSFRLRRDGVDITCAVETSARTGVEMEALTGACVAALTLYDMCKAVDKTMRVDGLRVLEKVKA